MAINIRDTVGNLIRLELKRPLVLPFESVTDWSRYWHDLPYAIELPIHVNSRGMIREGEGVRSFDLGAMGENLWK